MVAKSISKSQYMMGLQCVKRLWLYNYRKDLIPPTPPDQQLVFDQGTEVGKLAHRYFKNGSLIAYDHTQIPQAIEETKRLIQNGTDVIYEGAFVFNNVLVWCDVLEKNKDGSWNLIEVKSSANMHTEYYQDTAIQKYVLEGNGLHINSVQLMYINNQYVKKGDIDPHGFFKLQDITKEVIVQQRGIDQNLKAFMRALSDETNEPKIEIGQHCSTPYSCEFQNHCWNSVPAYSIYEVPNLGWEKKNQLKSMGIILIKDVPESFLTPRQRIYADAVKSCKPHVNKAVIYDFIKELEYPIYYIDFETINPVIPIYDGTRPYQQIPFQLSLHIQNEPNGVITHASYLGDGKTDPRPGLISFMLNNIGAKGSLVAYNAIAFEAVRMREMANDFPSYKKQLLEMTERIKDLMQPFLQGGYVHPNFHGSYSIKKVLPVLCPCVSSYKGLAVANGGDAQVAYLNILSGRLSADEIQKVRKDLEEYCKKDTESMVEILKMLYAMI